MKWKFPGVVLGGGVTASISLSQYFENCLKISKLLRSKFIIQIQPKKCLTWGFVIIPNLALSPPFFLNGLTRNSKFFLFPLSSPLYHFFFYLHLVPPCRDGYVISIVRSGTPLFESLTVRLSLCLSLCFSVYTHLFLLIAQLPLIFNNRRYFFFKFLFYFFNIYTKTTFS